MFACKYYVCPSITPAQRQVEDNRVGFVMENSYESFAFSAFTFVTQNHLGSRDNPQLIPRHTVI